MRAFLFFAVLAASIFASQADDDKRRGYPCCHESSSSSSCIIPPVPEPKEPCCETVMLANFDFDRTVPVVSADPINGWSYFDGKDDGKLTTGPCGGTLISLPFHDFVASDVFRQGDHYKYMLYANQWAQVPENGNLTVSWIASAKTKNTDQSPYPAAYLDDEDYRLANALLSAYDPENFLFYDMMLTNDRVYALYGALPTIGVAAFSVVVPMKVRKQCDWHKLKIKFVSADQSVSFNVDGHDGFRVIKPGFMGDRKYVVNDLGGVETLRFPRYIQYGFGTATFLDYYPTCQKIPGCDFCNYPQIREALLNLGNLNDVDTVPQFNPFLGAPIPAHYYADTQVLQDSANYHIWGQGVMLNMTRLAVYQDVCWE